MILKMNGEIVSDDVKRAVNYLKACGYPILDDYFAPMDLQDAIQKLPRGDRLEIKINSGGGDVLAGQEIYTMLFRRNDVDIEVESLAASAASVIAMAGPSSISPVGMIMIHNVSTFGAGGDHKELEKMADVLRQYDEALAGAYSAKTGKSKAEILALMDEESWLPAEKAVELGLIDKVLDQPEIPLVAGVGAIGQYDDILKQAAAMMREDEVREREKSEILKDLDQFGSK